MKRKRNNQKKIDYQEIVDRKMVIELFNQLFNDVKYTALPISAHTDLTITATTNNNIYQFHAEVKNRNILIDTFNNCYLEKTKYEHLKNDCKSHLPIYVAICPASNVICIWNLSKIDISTIPVKTIEMNEVTYINDEEEINKIQKDVYLLPIELSAKYQYNYAFSKQTA